MTFREWLQLREMATFELPPALRFDVPCQAGRCRAALVDMRFEDPPRMTDRVGQVMNQGSYFVAPLPGRGDFLVYGGVNGVRDRPATAAEAKLLVASGYMQLGPDWPSRALIADDQGNVVSHAGFERARQQALGA